MTVTEVQGGRAPARGTRPRAGRASPLGWLARPHSLPVEIAVVVVGYALYDGSRGIVAGGAAAAVAHARAIEHLESLVHLDVERSVQQWAGQLPGLLLTFAIGYATLHLLATAGTLLWLHRRDPSAYVRMRSAALLCSVVSLCGFVLWPTAPPRLDRMGIADTVTQSGISLGSHVLLLLYNPYAAFPSLHEAYAVLTGFAIWRYARRRWVRRVGAAYPVWVAAEVVATGNHFVLDVLAGAAVVGLSIVVTDLLLSADRRRDRPPATRPRSGPTPARSSPG